MNPVHEQSAARKSSKKSTFVLGFVDFFIDEVDKLSLLVISILLWFKNRRHFVLNLFLYNYDDSLNLANHEYADDTY